MKTFLFTLTLLLGSLLLSAQDGLVNNLKSATDLYLQAMVDADIDHILDAVHPNILEMGGGADFVRKDVISELEMFRNSGITYTNGQALDPADSYQVKDETFYLVPHEWTAKLGSDNYKSTQYLLASSQDEGETWSFINISKYNAKTLANYIPGFDENVEFPMASPFEIMN